MHGSKLVLVVVPEHVECGYRPVHWMTKDHKQPCLQQQTPPQPAAVGSSLCLPVLSLTVGGWVCLGMVTTCRTFQKCLPRHASGAAASNTYIDESCCLMVSLPLAKECGP
jgi:hypothetical protein